MAKTRFQNKTNATWAGVRVDESRAAAHSRESSAIAHNATRGRARDEEQRAAVCERRKDGDSFAKADCRRGEFETSVGIQPL